MDVGDMFYFLSFEKKTYACIWMQIWWRCWIMLVVRRQTQKNHNISIERAKCSVFNFTSESFRRIFYGPMFTYITGHRHATNVVSHSSKCWNKCRKLLLLLFVHYIICGGLQRDCIAAKNKKLLIFLSFFTPHIKSF